MLRHALAVVLFASGCATQRVPSSVESPVVAYPMGEQILHNREVSDGLSHLVRLSGYSRRAEERAGFLVIDEAGHFHLQAWPASNRYHAEEWSGALPRGTVAIAHTHPIATPAASMHDCAEALRLGIPMFVLTPDSVVLIGASDGKPHSIASRGWLTE